MIKLIRVCGRGRRLEIERERDRGCDGGVVCSSHNIKGGEYKQRRTFLICVIAPPLLRFM